MKHYSHRKQNLTSLCFLLDGQEKEKYIAISSFILFIDVHEVGSQNRVFELLLEISFIWYNSNLNYLYGLEIQKLRAPIAAPF